jgi:hypothetical protein
MISFTSDISAVADTEFVPVDRANDISQRIYVSVSHDSNGMRTEVGKSIQLILVTGNADFFPGAMDYSYTILLKAYFRRMAGNPVPFCCSCHQVKNADLYG